MFSFFSTLKVKRFLFAGLVLVLLAGVLGGCSTDAEDDDVNVSSPLPEALLGKWVSSYGDYFELTRSGSTINFKNATPGYPEYDTNGTVEYHSKYDDQMGLIIIKKSTGATPYHAYYYVNFIPGVSVGIHSTSNLSDNYSSADTATLEEAVGKFTKASMFEYVSASYFDSAIYYKE